MTVLSRNVTSVIINCNITFHLMASIRSSRTINGVTIRRRLRADAERSAQAILDAAERLLSADPEVTIEEIAAAAGVSRTTVHRHFATRDALADALADAAVRQMKAAVDDARLMTAPPLIALHQATVGILRVKLGRRFSIGHLIATEQATNQLHAEVREQWLAWFRRAQEAGVIRPEADLHWARRVYEALIDETFHGEDADADPDALAERVTDTLLGAFGTGPRS